MLISDSAELAASMLQSGGLAGLSRHATAAAAVVAAPGGTCGVRRAISTSVVACSCQGQREREGASHKLLLSSDRLARRLSTTAAVAMESAPMPSITLDNMNPAIKKMEYAVRGPLVIRANAIEKELEKVIKSYARWHCQNKKALKSLKLNTFFFFTRIPTGLYRVLESLKG